MNSLIPSNRLSNGLFSMKPNRDDLFYPFQQLFDKFYDEFWSDNTLGSLKSRVGYPKWDIYTDEKNWVVEVVLPGMDSEDVKVEILPAPESSAYDRLLKISGRMSESHQTGDSVHYLTREVRRSHFERCVYLPNSVQGDPEATMSNGILRLSWKLPEEQQPEARLIPIQKLDKSDSK